MLDRLLGGGLPLDGITELAGCSSAGKTQLALQLCLAVQFPQRHGGLEAGEWTPPRRAVGVGCVLAPSIRPGLRALPTIHVPLVTLQFLHWGWGEGHMQPPSAAAPPPPPAARPRPACSRLPGWPWPSTGRGGGAHPSLQAARSASFPWWGEQGEARRRGLPRLAGRVCGRSTRHVQH